MTLTAPEHLRGDMRNKPASTRAERRQWVLEQAIKGHSGRAIARALGVTPHATARLLAECGYVKPRANNTEVLKSKGILTGAIGPSIDAMPYGAREVLATRAARTRKPMAAVLADFWAQHHGADA